jgi:hypothetical protein
MNEDEGETIHKALGYGALGQKLALFSSSALSYQT